MAALKSRCSLAPTSQHGATGPEALALLVATKSLTSEGKQHQSFKWPALVSVPSERGEEASKKLLV